MSKTIFTGLSSTDDQSVNSSHKTSWTFYRRTPRERSASVSHVSPLVHMPFIKEALNEARTSLKAGGIPIGCVLVRNNQIIARGHNRCIQRESVILHAIMDCLESAGRQTIEFYKECTLYTTVAPCAMCTGTMRLYGIPRLVIGENKTYRGDDELLRTSNIHIDVLDSKECQELLENYIKENKSTWLENIGRTE